LRAQVGDRHVMGMLNQQGGLLGGESSGHILCLDRTSTGDAIVAALQILVAMNEAECSLNELKSGMSKMPQCMINVPTQEGFDYNASSTVKKTLKAAETELGGAGRVLLRPSGTEPVIRVMVEGADAQLVKTLSQRIADCIAAGK